MKFSINLMFCLCLFFMQSKAQQTVNEQGNQNDSGYAYHKPLYNFDYNKPVFKLQGEQLSNTSHYLRYTALSGYREGVSPTSGFSCYSSFFDPQNGTVRMYSTNHSIEDLMPRSDMTSMWWGEENV
jgi:hypothetical protein